MYVMQMSPDAGPFASVDLLSMKLKIDLKKKKDVVPTITEQHQPTTLSSTQMNYSQALVLLSNREKSTASLGNVDGT